MYSLNHALANRRAHRTASTQLTAVNRRTLELHLGKDLSPQTQKVAPRDNRISVVPQTHTRSIT